MCNSAVSHRSEAVSFVDCGRRAILDCAMITVKLPGSGIEKVANPHSELVAYNNV